MAEESVEITVQCGLGRQTFSAAGMMYYDRKHKKVTEGGRAMVPAYLATSGQARPARQGCESARSRLSGTGMADITDGLPLTDALGKSMAEEAVSLS